MSNFRSAGVEPLAVDRVRLREVDQHHVEQSLHLRARASILRDSEDEATPGDLVGILAGLVGHGDEQVRVTHGFLNS
ncbi:MAG: hypothetical protein FJ284_15585 [Planctomycetes bacterium]|nr:hypothetical protein [Planctomycetota bacterium]